jgi:hypothetical protein
VSALALLTGEQEDHHLDAFLELGLHHLDPVVRTHARFDLAHHGLSFVITTCVETFLHGALKLVGNLSISVTVEDGPVLELSLGEHLTLDLAVDFTCALLNVEGVRSSTGVGPHEEIAGVVLEALEFLRVLIKLQMPERLLLLALLVGLEVVHEVLDLLDLGFSIGMDDLGEILHETEVCTHRVSQSCQLAQFRDESDLSTCPSVLVDQQGLVGVLDVLVVLRLVVLTVAGLGALLVEAGLRTLSKVNAVDLVRLLIVLGDDSRTGESKLDSLITVLVPLLSSLSGFVHHLEHRVSTDDLEADVHVQESSLFLHDQTRVEAWPNLDIVGIKRMSVCLIE